jgi:cytidylate kinase
MDVGIFKPGTHAEARTLIERQVRHWDYLAAVLKKTSPEKTLAEVSKRPVLTVSGAVGSGRERLAAALCRDLEYELFGCEILDAVAQDLHCQRMLLDSLDERVQSNLKTIFESLIHGKEIENRDYFRALVRVMGALAEKGGVVIVGRGGAFILKEKAALRIRVDAPYPLCLRRIMEWRKLDEEEARRYIETKEQEQRKFCRRYFHREICDPLAFDLTINTERIEPAKAVGLVRAALAERGIEIHKPTFSWAAGEPAGELVGKHR